MKLLFFWIKMLFNDIYRYNPYAQQSPDKQNKYEEFTNRPKESLAPALSTKVHLCTNLTK